MIAAWDPYERAGLTLEIRTPLVTPERFGGPLTAERTAQTVAVMWLLSATLGDLSLDCHRSQPCPQDSTPRSVARSKAARCPLRRELVLREMSAW